nr:uncharacterized protein LOC123276715 [Equus asinus]
MEKISTATMTSPLVLLCTGRKVIQTLQNTSMLNVRHLASLKLPGRLLARKAKVKLMKAKEPKYPKESAPSRSAKVRSVWAGPQEFSQEGVPVAVRSPPPKGGGGAAATGERLGGGARARRGARGCWATVRGGVGGEPRLPAQSQARRSPAALCCSLPGRARSSVPPASVDSAPCPRWAQQPGPSTAMAASLRRPSFSSRSSCSLDTDDQGAREDDSIWERLVCLLFYEMLACPKTLKIFS